MHKEMLSNPVALGKSINAARSRSVIEQRKAVHKQSQYDRNASQDAMKLPTSACSTAYSCHAQPGLDFESFPKRRTRVCGAMSRMFVGGC